MTSCLGLIRDLAIAVIIGAKELRSEKPHPEAASIASHRARTLLPQHHHGVLQTLVSMLLVMKKPICHGHCHDAVIRVRTFVMEQGETVFFRVAELIDRTYGVPGNCSQHKYSRVFNGYLNMTTYYWNMRPPQSNGGPADHLSRLMDGRPVRRCYDVSGALGPGRSASCSSRRLARIS